MVRREIETDPGITNQALRAKAKRIARSVDRLSGPQFHAMYRLRAAREVAAAKPESGARQTARRSRSNTGTASAASQTSPPVARDAVWAVLLELATEVAAADTASVIGVIGSLGSTAETFLVLQSTCRTCIRCGLCAGPSCTRRSPNRLRTLRRFVRVTAS